MPTPIGDVIEVGRIGRPYGVKGWVHVHSDMEPPAGLLQHPTWWLGGGRGHGWSERGLGEGRSHGAGLVARIEGCASRADAERLRGLVIGLRRDAFAQPEADEFYWTDLIGAEVVGPRGEVLGNVTAFMETGANDVMVVTGDRERLIPFVIHDTVAQVDLIGRKVVVNWDPEF